MSAKHHTFNAEPKNTMLTRESSCANTKASRDVKRPYELSVFLSSPKDLTLERNELERLCNLWTESKGQSEDTRLAVKRWENDLAIGSGQKPQEMINEQLLNEADILIGIFWTRFGSPTEKADSGTEEEIEQFLSSGKPVMLYFLEKHVNPMKLDTAQFEKVKAFQSRYRDKGVYRIIGEEESLEQHFDKDISHNVDKVLTNVVAPRSKRAEWDLQVSDLLGAPTIITRTDDAWFELSIRDLIANYLEGNNLAWVQYTREITFEENCSLWRGHDNYEAIRRTAEKAREFAFSKKYGRYNYDLDLRTHFQTSWFAPILERVKRLDLKTSTVIGIGSNNGRELSELALHMPGSSRFEVLDISYEAVDHGRREFPQFVFQHGNMENSSLRNSHYDVGLNLRSIHSSGVEMRAALADLYRVLKPGGLAVVSISNGYLLKDESTGELVEVKGMYTREGVFSKDKPYRLAEKVREKMADYRFQDTATITGDTEIFVFGRKKSALKNAKSL